MSDAPFDGLERLVPGEVRLVATPRQWVDEFGQWNKGPWAMVITTGRVALAKPKTFGGIKIGLDVSITEFRRGRTGLRDAGPLFESYNELNQGTVAFLFDSNDAAEAVHEYINSGVAFAAAVGTPSRIAQPGSGADQELPAPPEGSFTVAWEFYLYAESHRDAAERGLTILGDRSGSRVFEIVDPLGRHARYEPGVLRWGESPFVRRSLDPGEFRVVWTTTVPGDDPAQTAWSAWMIQCEGGPSAVRTCLVTDPSGDAQRIAL